jgi:hypothetical protein
MDAVLGIRLCMVHTATIREEWQQWRGSFHGRVMLKPHGSVILKPHDHVMLKPHGCVILKPHGSVILKPHGRVEATWPCYVEATRLCYIEATRLCYVEATLPCYIEATWPCYVEPTRPCYVEATLPCYIEATLPCYIEATWPCYVEATLPCYIEATRLCYVEATRLLYWSHMALLCWTHTAMLWWSHMALLCWSHMAVLCWSHTADMSAQNHIRDWDARIQIQTCPPSSSETFNLNSERPRLDRRVELTGNHNYFKLTLLYVRCETWTVGKNGRITFSFHVWTTLSFENAVFCIMRIQTNHLTAICHTRHFEDLKWKGETHHQHCNCVWRLSSRDKRVTQ